MKFFLTSLSQIIRCAGWPECVRARDFLIKQFKKIGVTLNFDDYNFPAWKPQKAILKINGKKVSVIPVGYSGSGKVSGFLKKSRPIKTFEAYPFQRWAICDNKGKTKAYVLSRPDQVWYQPLNKPARLPYIMAEREVFRKWNEAVQKGKKVTAEIEVKTKHWPSKIHNLYSAEPKGKHILLTCHYDSVPMCVGANDNGTGCLAVHELAKKYKQAKKLQYILFCAEEWNKAGSYAFADQLSAKSLKNIQVMINIDMIGARGGTLHAIVSPQFQEIMENIQQKTDFEFSVSTKIRPPFDVWPFYLKKVPIIHLGCFPYRHCHRPTDTVDKVDFVNVQRTIEIIEQILPHFK